MTGRLILAATPIGDVDDASPRLRRALESADVIAAEDTRRLLRLANSLGATLAAPVVAYHDSVERERLPRLMEKLRGGALVVLVTDAGMPSVSDPGYRLVEAAVREGVDVSVIPGPSAVTTALAVSGLPVDRFCFEGFLPRRSGERSARLADLASERRTMVFFEAPHRLAAMLTALEAAFGSERAAAVCRELTKTHEEVVRGTLSELVAWTEGGVRGEVTLVVAGADASSEKVSGDDLVARVQALVALGSDRREAISEVARTSGLPRRAVFDAMVAAKPRTS
ncbi:MAG: 16S rRNA (cytidine(1402)-2'-O)-methyltransferase [Actinobacteria bacterium]|nr:16S rRNA (cytidine(1402)-2'-O)-methyltransferase [Actinomycetota bacterium]